MLVVHPSNKKWRVLIEWFQYSQTTNKYKKPKIPLPDLASHLTTTTYISELRQLLKKEPPFPTSSSPPLHHKHKRNHSHHHHRQQKHVIQLKHKSFFFVKGDQWRGSPYGLDTRWLLDDYSCNSALCSVSASLKRRERKEKRGFC